MFLGHIFDSLIDLVLDYFLEFSKIMVIGDKKFRYFFAVSFVFNANQLVNWVVSFEICVIVKENILYRHCDGLCYIFIKLYWDRANFFRFNPKFPDLHFETFSHQICPDCCFYPSILIAMCLKAEAEWKSSKVEEDVMGLVEMIVKGFVYLIGQKVCWIYEWAHLMLIGCNLDEQST